MASSNDIRATFLDYFARNGHEVVPSSPLVPRNDPTLLFTNSGMVQFKNVFTGGERRPYTRATTAQKCVRAGGKHNDLDNVGYTARHHTFFEMMGNFSFADYFKTLAIEHAWTLVTRDFGLPADRLLVTVYSEDDEAAELWRRIARLPDGRIIRIPTSDNFWRMGDAGPCGPCSEIFYDHGEQVPGGPPGSPDEDGDRFIEIWNLVFMQFDENPPGTRTPLPRPSIDTGLGLERFAAILQGVHDNYDTDTFRALIAASAEATGQAPDGPHRVGHRVIADHLRSTSFLIADGVLPSNEGRGYVLRRIMRRAMRHLHMMGTREPTFHRLVPALIRQMGAAYPELGRAEGLITDTMRLEEGRFTAMLDRGLHLLAEETARLGEGGTLPGEVAFRLYDTFGFPLDLTQDALREGGRAVDIAGFEAAMTEQRRRARAAWAGSGEAATERVWFDLREAVGATEFLGYATEAAQAELRALVVDGAPVGEASAGTAVAVLLNQTPFYGESGGQVGDTGSITGEGFRIAVTDTQRRLGDLVVHLGQVEEGVARVGSSVRAELDHARRGAIRAHHSATHLLHEALRRRLGTHVAQKGSLNAPDRLRFDVSHPKPMSAEQPDTFHAHQSRLPVECAVVADDAVRVAHVAAGIVEIGHGGGKAGRVQSQLLALDAVEIDHRPSVGVAIPAAFDAGCALEVDARGMKKRVGHGQARSGEVDALQLAVGTVGEAVAVGGRGGFRAEGAAAHELIACIVVEVEEIERAGRGWGGRRWRSGFGVEQRRSQREGREQGREQAWRSVHGVAGWPGIRSAASSRIRASSSCGPMKTSPVARAGAFSSGSSSSSA